MPVKKILIISNTSRSLFNYRRWLINDLIELGHEVTVACNFDDYIDDLRGLDVSVVKFDISRRDKSIIEVVKALRVIRKLVLSESWSLVQTTTIKPNIYTAMACFGTNVKVFSMVTGLGVAVDGKRKIFSSTLFKMMYKIIGANSKRVFVQGRSNTEFLVNNGYISRKKITTINGSGVDLDYFYKSELPPYSGEVKMIFAGRLLKSKGLPNIVGLVKVANARGYKCSLKIFGRLEQPSPDSITKEELDSYNAIAGVCVEPEIKDVRKYIAEAHCLVLLTKYGEGIPKSLLEASSMQRVVLVSDADSSVELVKDKYNGYVLSEKNGEFSVEEFCSFLSHYDDYNQVAQRARQVVEKSYSCESVNNVIINEYRKWGFKS